MTFSGKTHAAISMLIATQTKASLEIAMTMLKEKWLGGGADVAIRAAFSFAMCGALVGVIYLTAQDGLADGSSGQQQPRAATVLASMDTRPQADRLPVPVTTKASSITLPASAPVVALTDIRPVIPTKRPTPPIKLPAGKGDVARFDSCLPDCETRDPMIIGYAGKARQIEPASSQDDDPQIEQTVSLPVVAGATELLDKAFDVPGAAFRKGKSVITRVVNATL